MHDAFRLSLLIFSKDLNNFKDLTRSPSKSKAIRKINVIRPLTYALSL